MILVEADGEEAAAPAAPFVARLRTPWQTVLDFYRGLVPRRFVEAGRGLQLLALGVAPLVVTGLAWLVLGGRGISYVVFLAGATVSTTAFFTGCYLAFCGCWGLWGVARHRFSGDPATGPMSRVPLTAAGIGAATLAASTLPVALCGYLIERSDAGFFTQPFQFSAPRPSFTYTPPYQSPPSSVRNPPAVVPEPLKSKKRVVRYDAAMTLDTSFIDPHILRQRIQTVLNDVVRQEGCEPGRGMVFVIVGPDGVVSSLQTGGVFQDLLVPIHGRLYNRTTATRGRDINSRVAYMFEVE